MKRSEMVDELKELISMVRYEDAINMSGGATIVPTAEYADIILAKLEKLGMQPPNIKKYAPNGSLWNISPGWDKE